MSPQPASVAVTAAVPIVAKRAAPAPDPAAQALAEAKKRAIARLERELEERRNPKPPPTSEQVEAARTRHRARIRELLGFEPHPLMADYNPLTYPAAPSDGPRVALAPGDYPVEVIDARAEWEKARAEEVPAPINSVNGVYYLESSPSAGALGYRQQRGERLAAEGLAAGSCVLRDRQRGREGDQPAKRRGFNQRSRDWR
jgi:hypothetical protein